MNNLVVIPFHDFKVALKDGYRTRDTHLYEHFMQNKLIDNLIIINRPTSLIEVVLKKKKVLSLKNIIYKDNFCYIQQYAENIYIIDFFVLDFFNVIIKRHSWLPFIYAKKSIANKVIKALQFLQIEKFSVYMSMPFSVEMAFNINADIKILDAVDNFAKYKNWNYFKLEIDALYDKAKNDFNFIYVNSQDTYNYLQDDCRAYLQLLPNGVDIEKFIGNFNSPVDLPNTKPIVGYAGKMQRMFDAKLLEKLASKYPNYNFVLLGKFLDPAWKKKYWDGLMSKKDNIYFLGDKKYDELPAYYNNFDICMIPYKVENQHGGDPIKFYEYMACNKPIISTNIGNIKKFHDGKSIFICDNDKEFIDKFEYLIENMEDLKISYNLPTEITWKNIANIMIDEIYENKKIVSK